MLILSDPNLDFRAVYHLGVAKAAAAWVGPLLNASKCAKYDQTISCSMEQYRTP